MKQTTLYGLAFVLLLIGAGTAYAETDVQVNAAANLSVTAPKPAVKPLPLGAKPAENRMDPRTASSTDGKDMRNASTTRADVKAEVQANMQARIESMRQEQALKLNKMGARFEATIAREEGLMTRILSRIEKIKATGGKTDAAEKMVMDAKKHIDEAKGMLATLKANVDASVALTGTTATTTAAKKDIKTADQNIRKTTMAIEKHIQEAHKLLEKSVGTLRGVNGEKLQATTTVDVKTTNTQN